MSGRTATASRVGALAHTSTSAENATAARGGTDAHASVIDLQRRAGNQAVLSLLRPLTDAAAAEDAAARAARAALANDDGTGGTLRPLRPAPAREGIAGRRLTGRRLPHALRTFFERRLGYDLGAVRIATAARAADAAHRLGARAFASGRQIVFGDREFNPGSPGGRLLLAHELAHVIQQALARRPAVQLQPKRKLGYEIPRFEFTGGEQQATAETSGGWADLSWDAAAGVFECTFRLRWRSFPTDPPNVPLGWGKPENQAIFKNRFIQTVRSAWENKYPLLEYAGDRPTGRTAKVLLKFEEVVDAAPTSVEEITRRSQLPADEFERLRSKFDIDVKLEDVRDSVAAGSVVQVDAASLTAERQDVSQFRKKERFEHYAREKLTLDIPPERQSYEQTAAVHEFGHMIGLADEYVMSAEDFERAKSDLGATEAKRRLRERTRVTGRVMNVGSAITADEYRPFARWLSDLSGGDWRVKGDSGTSPAASPERRKTTKKQKGLVR